jgi:hypothetical protein
MKSLNWKDGLPEWLRDDESPRRIDNVYVEHAIACTTDDEIVTIVVGWTERPATRTSPMEVENERWSVYISREEIDFGDGGEREAIDALDRILENSHITLEE